MAASAVTHLQFSKDSRKGLFLLPVCLAFVSSVFFFLASTSKLHIGPGQTRLNANPPLEFLKISSQPIMGSRQVIRNQSLASRVNATHFSEADRLESPPDYNTEYLGDAFHDRTLFMKDYEHMKKSLKIYAYPHKKDDPFANVLLPDDSTPGGNYASESYFKKALFSSGFLTDDPSKADLFYLPFSIASLRHDPRVGVGGIQDFIKDYVSNVSRRYPFWNRTGGADHFYVACHSVGRSAMEKAVRVRLNAIQVVCSSSYFLPGYVAHKDASIPQIWPRSDVAPTRSPSERKTLAFYAGAMNSRVRESLVRTWANDSDISVHHARLKTPYSESLLGSKYCIHAKGFEVNTARVADALYYGCVPVVVADHYDLPFADVLDWARFSVVVAAADIPFLKRILQEEIGERDYVRLQGNVMRVREHFLWHDVPVDYDAFHMVMYELWLRRSWVRVLF